MSGALTKPHLFFLLTLFSFSFCITPSTMAATITVDINVDEAVAANGNCTLREAVTAANTDAAVDNCAAGNGADTIAFTAGANGTIALIGLLPTITTPVTVTGNGQASTIIDGAGVTCFVATANITINNLTLQNCGSGAGVSGAGALSVKNITVQGSTGFALASFNCPTVTNSSVINNKDMGILCSSGNLQLTNSNVSNNTFDGIRLVTGASCTVSNSTISGNKNGIYLVAGKSCTVTNSTISNNIASGIVGGSITSITVTGSTISGNQSSGIAGYGADVKVTNSTISGNGKAGAWTAGIWKSFTTGALTLVNATVTNNKGNGGGLGLWNGPVSFKSSNSIIANNQVSDCTDGGWTFVTTSQGHNIDSDNTCGLGGGAGDQVGQAITLPALANNGGNTLTHSPAGTIAENANTTCANASATSQNGVARPGGTGCDIGAVEIAALAPRKKKNKAPIYDPDGDGNHNGDEDWLVFPSASAHENANVVFIWKALTDPEGTEVTYQLYVCKDGDFDNCVPTQVTHTARYAAAGMALGAGLLIFGLGFTRSGRRSLVALALAALLITSSGAMVACSKSSSGSDEETATLTCDDASSDEVCQTSLSLEAGDYQWMVVAEDAKGKQLASGTRKLTVE